MSTARPRDARLTLLPALLLLAGCSTAYYGVMEQFGVQKRHILVDRVEAGQEAQQEAQEQFKSTYQALKEVAGLSDDDLEPFYERMNGELEDCEAQATEVRNRIDSIQDVAEDLFDEWATEIAQISSADLRRKSERSRKDSQRRYDKMVRAMQRAESKMDPVLVAFRDRVLALKHTLNARAVAALEGTVLEIESDVDSLIEEMQAAIREAESFLSTMRS